MFDRMKFEKEIADFAKKQAQDSELKAVSEDFLIKSDKYNYAYQWSWLGQPVIQMPQDILMTHELIWQTKPDVIIETGVAWGGSVVMYASVLQLLGKGVVHAVDLNLADSVVDALEDYPFSSRIKLYKGSSIDEGIFGKISETIKENDKVMVLLDSNHSHEHVLNELKLYAPLVTKGQYLIVSDTVIEDIPHQDHRPRPWGRGDNPKTALFEYLKTTDRFVVDEEIDNKLLVSFTPNGFVKAIK